MTITVVKYFTVATTLYRHQNRPTFCAKNENSKVVVVVFCRKENLNATSFASVYNSYFASLFITCFLNCSSSKVVFENSIEIKDDRERESRFFFVSFPNRASESQIASIWTESHFWLFPTMATFGDFCLNFRYQPVRNRKKIGTIFISSFKIDIM